MRATRWLRWIVLFSLAVLAGCSEVAVPEAGGPTPVSITLSGGAGEVRLGPGDGAWLGIVDQLNNLISGLDTPLYADYPPERVAAEILVGPHLLAVYSPTATLKGKGYEAEAGQLIVAVSGEGPLVLIRAAEGANWTASEASDGGRFTSLFRTIQERTGIDLGSAG